VIVESEKRPLFRRCRPHEPYAESLLLRDMAQTLRVCGVWCVAGAFACEYLGRWIDVVLRAAV
jgi:hypothetical protein